MNTRGFTLLELVLVVSLIAILATMAMPNIGGAHDSGHVEVMKGDLQNISAQQEMHFSSFNQYASAIQISGVPDATTMTFRRHQDVTITFNNVTSAGYQMRSEHDRLRDQKCELSFSVVAGTDLRCGHNNPDWGDFSAP
jgi:prepilin-type N-terminal cleavage/methylation domain-containing protein